MRKAKYVRFPVDIFDDDKVKKLEKYPEGSELFCLWLEIVLKATLKNRQGAKEFRIANIDLSDEALNAVFGYNGNSIIHSLGILQELGFLKREKKAIIVFPFWLDRHDRSSTRYKEWRMSVFKRDGFACRTCGTKLNLQAHHLVAWADCRDNTELRYATENGITLCRSCHLEAHGGRWRK